MKRIILIIFIIILQGCSPKEITLIGDKELYLEVGSEFQDPGAIIDKGDVYIKGNVDTDRLGTYILRYSDEKERIIEERTIHVVDTTEPEIILKGSSVISIFLGEKYSDPGVKVNDNYDKDLIATTVNNVDINKAGHYLVKYIATDSNGNTNEAIRTVNVYNIDMNYNTNYISDIEPTTNAEMVVVGSNGSDIYMEKFFNNNAIFTFDVDIMNYEYSELSNIYVDSENNYLISGYMYKKDNELNKYNRYGLLMKLNELGEYVWSYEDITNDSLIIKKILEDEDGYVCIGTITYSNDKIEAVIYKINKNGNLEWKIIYDDYYSNYIKDIEIVEDGYIALINTINTELIGNDVLIKITKDGSIESINSNLEYYLHDLNKSNNVIYAVGNSRNSTFQTSIVNVSNNLDVSNFINVSNEYEMSTMLHLEDNSIVLAGIKIIHGIYELEYQPVLVHITENGNHIFEREYGEKDQFVSVMDIIGDDLVIVNNDEYNDSYIYVIDDFLY